MTGSARFERMARQHVDLVVPVLMKKRGHLRDVLFRIIDAGHKGHADV